MNSNLDHRRRPSLAAAGLAASAAGSLIRRNQQETNPMSYIKVGQENSQPIDIDYEDHGSGSSCSSTAGH
jgi:hypothetical protein